MSASAAPPSRTAPETTRPRHYPALRLRAARAFGSAAVTGRLLHRRVRRAAVRTGRRSCRAQTGSCKALARSVGRDRRARGHRREKPAHGPLRTRIESATRSTVRASGTSVWHSHGLQEIAACAGLLTLDASRARRRRPIARTDVGLPPRRLSDRSWPGETGHVPGTGSRCVSGILRLAVGLAGRRCFAHCVVDAGRILGRDVAERHDADQLAVDVDDPRTRAWAGL